MYYLRNLKIILNLEIELIKTELICRMLRSITKWQRNYNYESEKDSKRRPLGLVCCKGEHQGEQGPREVRGHSGPLFW